MRRRQFLAATSFLSTAAVAGCLDFDDPTPPEEVVIEFYQFESEARDMSFSERKQRVAELFHSESPTTEYHQYRRAEYDPPYVELESVETTVVEENVGADGLRESRIFKGDSELVSEFAGENALIEVEVEYSGTSNTVTSSNVAFVVKEAGEWRIFSWGLPGYYDPSE